MMMNVSSKVKLVCALLVLTASGFLQLAICYKYWLMNIMTLDTDS